MIGDYQMANMNGVKGSKKKTGLFQLQNVVLIITIESVLILFFLSLIIIMGRAHIIGYQPMGLL